MLALVLALALLMLLRQVLAIVAAVVGHRSLLLILAAVGAASALHIAAVDPVLEPASFSVLHTKSTQTPRTLAVVVATYLPKDAMAVMYRSLLVGSYAVYRAASLLAGLSRPRSRCELAPSLCDTNDAWAKHIGIDEADRDRMCT